ncbi:UvrB/UvrC motif-containing protein, partial [Candidatus Saccharibacteria bacterium]|nr:UvrB/UvrC motif-containing protein [Candidatus Saccharibacteria bacterium]
HHITPQSISKEVSVGLRAIIPEKNIETKLDLKRIPKEDIPALIKQLTSEMQLAAANLEFERAAFLRDEIAKIKGEQN